MPSCRLCLTRREVAGKALDIGQKEKQKVMPNKADVLQPLLILSFVAIHDGISLVYYVIPGLTRNPVFAWIPAFAGMTSFA
jgi:hypothetical protein